MKSNSLRRKPILMTRKMTIPNQQKQGEQQTTQHHLLPALGLFLLAPLVGEFLLGNLSITSLGLLLLLAPLYGGGALLIRETVRRCHWGWPSMIVLCVAYGLIEEAFVTQSLFNPNYVGLRLLDYGYLPILGISAWWTLFVLSIHTIWSTAVPIALVESFTPHTRHTPWLGYWWLSLVAILFVSACVLLFFFQPDTAFRATNGQFLTSAVVVVLLVAVALALGRAQPTQPTITQIVPSPWVVGVTALAIGSAFLLLARTHEPLPAWLNVAGLLLLLIGGSGLFWRWANRSGWSAHHGLAVAGGLLLTYAWYGFVQIPSTGGATPLIDTIGNAIFAAGAVVLLLVAAKR